MPLVLTPQTELTISAEMVEIGKGCLVQTASVFGGIVAFAVGGIISWLVFYLLCTLGGAAYGRPVQIAQLAAFIAGSRFVGLPLVEWLVHQIARIARSLS